MEQWEESLQTAMDERFDAAFAEILSIAPFYAPPSSTTQCHSF